MGVFLKRVALLTVVTLFLSILPLPASNPIPQTQRNIAFATTTTTGYEGNSGSEQTGNGTETNSSVTIPHTAGVANSGGAAFQVREILAAGEAWTNRNPTASPSPRNGHMMVYCPNSGQVVLFGGTDGSSVLGDTWTYSPTANTWMNRSPTTSPTARFAQAMAYSSSIGQVVLFGGWNGSSNLADTWTYSPTANTWTNMNPTTSPTARNGSAMVYDSNTGQVVLFGGNGSSNLADTWTYSPTANTWTNQNPTISPPARVYHAMAYDESNGQVILFGGNGSSDLADTWTYSPTANTWMNMNPTTSPPARGHCAMAYDASAGQAILFGGRYSSSGLLNDTWSYSPITNTWTNRNPTASPTARDVHTLVYDASASQVVLFGGRDGSGLQADTWTLGSGISPALSLLSPLGGEVWLVGDTYAITWTSTDLTGTVTVEASYDNGGTWSVLSTTSPIIGSYSWTPSQTSSQARVRVTGAGNGKEVSSTSGAFQVVLLGHSLPLAPGWNLISLPLITSPTPSDVFNGLPAGWVLFAWDAANSRYLGGDLVTLTLGNGYWLKLPGSSPLDYDVSGTLFEESEKAISLATGWNIIGVPYPSDYAWDASRIRRLGNDATLDQAAVNGWIANVAYYWTGSGYGNARFSGGFQAWKGYWLKALVSGCELVFWKP